MQTKAQRSRIKDREVHPGYITNVYTVPVSCTMYLTSKAAFDAAQGCTVVYTTQPAGHGLQRDGTQSIALVLAHAQT